MHKLTNVEAQRVMSVLDETIDNLSVLTSVPVHPNYPTLDTLTDMGHGAVCNELMEQWQLGESQRVIMAKATGGGGGNGGAR